MENTKINLELTVREVNAILAGLAKLPYEAVAEIITSIRTQGEAQVRLMSEKKEAETE